MLDVRHRRPDGHPGQQGVDGSRFALENRLHPAVGEVANPARHPASPGCARGFLAEEHSLDPAGDPDVGSHRILFGHSESLSVPGVLPKAREGYAPGAMNVPIWVSAWELECCQPDATVGERWVASVIGLRPPEPWWAEHAPDPIPEEVRSLGVVDMEGTAASRTLHSRSTIVDIGGSRVIVPDVTGSGIVKVHGRLWLDAHEHPEYRGTEGLVWTGVVRRIRGIRLIYQPVTVYLAIPVRQEKPVELSSTSDRNDPAMSDRGFSEFLIDLDL